MTTAKGVRQILIALEPRMDANKHELRESYGETSRDEKDGKPRVKLGSKSDKTRPLVVVEITDFDNC
jgi:hypothetical protein